MASATIKYSKQEMSDTTNLVPPYAGCCHLANVMIPEPWPVYILSVSWRYMQCTVFTYMLLRHGYKQR